ncbi:MAG: peptidylprolyl isomerase [Gemmatimonadota bacterium]|jgi:hypothetical protein
MRRSGRRLITTLACGLTLAGCDTGPDALLLARAADHRLTVDEAVRLLAGARDVPNQPELVETFANLWVDYTLLAHAVAEDSTLSQIDFGPLVDQQVEVWAIGELRDSMVTPDTTISDDELRTLYEAEGSGVEVHARHILVAFPQNATSQAQIDSVRRLAGELRDRALAGEDFAALAREFSDDPGSASRGGDLGYFPRGEMVKPFDEAAFALQPGEISDVVETPYGYHVIRVEDRRVPDFDEVRQRIRGQALRRRVFEAESTYVAGIMEGAGVEVTEDGIELTRRMARDPRTRLSGRAARRTVARYAGGEITVGEVRDFMLTVQPQYRAQVTGADDDVVRDAVIQDLVRREMLLARARDAGFEPSTERVDSVTEIARQRFLATARQLGLASLEAQPGESSDAALERRVSDVLESMLRGEREVLPVSAIGFILRRAYPSEVYVESAVPRVIDGVADARGPTGAQAPPGREPRPDTAAPGGG